MVAKVGGLILCSYSMAHQSFGQSRVTLHLSIPGKQVINYKFSVDSPLEVYLLFSMIGALLTEV